MKCARRRPRRRRPRRRRRRRANSTIAKWRLAAAAGPCQNICCAVRRCVNSRRATFTYRLGDTDSKWAVIVQLSWKGFVTLRHESSTFEREREGGVLILCRANYNAKYSESEIKQLSRLRGNASVVTWNDSYRLRKKKEKKKTPWEVPILDFRSHRKIRCRKETCNFRDRISADTWRIGTRSRHEPMWSHDRNWLGPLRRDIKCERMYKWFSLATQASALAIEKPSLY